MDPHGVPSGGDWALERLGAVFLEGTVGLSINTCLFERLDGNGVMISGFNRGVSIINSHFAWTGTYPISLAAFLLLRPIRLPSGTHLAASCMSPSSDDIYVCIPGGFC